MMLALALYYNYGRTDRVDDIDEAIELSVQVVNATGPQDIAWVGRMKNLVVFVKSGSQCGMHSRGTYMRAYDNIEDLNTPIDLVQHAMTDESAPLETRRSSAIMVMPLLDDKYSSTRCVAVLAFALRTDFRVRGDMKKLDKAFDLITRVTQCRTLSVEDYLDGLCNLSAICQTRYNTRSNEDDLDTCLNSALKALDVEAPDGNVMLRVASLIAESSAYNSKAARYGDLENIQIAVRYTLEARELAADKALDIDVLAELDVALSQGLVRRYHHQQGLDDISEALETLQHPRTISSEHFQFPTVLNNLGETSRVKLSRREM
ncbi:CHAT domain-containing protein [Fusarium bulbicola]|nr:CHAT domain-containing protein [Fusarium bulbicola]